MSKSDCDNMDPEDIDESDNCDDIIEDANGEYIDIGESEMMEGIVFKTDDVAVLSIQKWTEKTFCPLSKIRYQKGQTKHGEYIKGRRCFRCPHGVQRKSKTAVQRPTQRLKYSKCQVKINLNEQDDGSWMITSCYLKHSGHPVTEQNFLSHHQARKLNVEDKLFVKGLIKARTNPRNIADVLSERTGMSFTAQNVRNLIHKIKEADKDTESVEKVLGDIKDAGGDVRYKKEDDSNNVDVLWIQTKDMKSMLAKCKPQVFECDTTFGTQVEGYKLFIPLFHSNFTDKWEVGGLLFLSTETKEKVEVGIEFFKSSLPYRVEDGVTKFIFFTDKDFDYIQVTKCWPFMHQIIMIQ